jgi:toxin ParE1/3/4
MPDVIQSPQARADLLELWLRIAAENEAAADALLDEIETVSQRLATFPELGRIRSDVAPGLRSLAVGNYVIFYRVLSSTVEIARVVHGARDLPPLFQ